MLSTNMAKTQPEIDRKLLVANVQKAYKQHKDEMTW